MSRSDDKREAKAKVYALQGGPNPYPEGSRMAGFYEKFRAHYWAMEARFDDLAEVYGEFRPDRIEGENA
ncbi:hypothetical protein [Paracoccus zeaxanthinifaciens]|uniref:hypothetical protein n=1 Tax=Paracoccus zeaxanthinifaciens TaxID=187400 RepID=UPI0003B4D31D|nr:hypothetical protein [Paracoccus zeaxanthinifaciens]